MKPAAGFPGRVSSLAGAAGFEPTPPSPPVFLKLNDFNGSFEIHRKIEEFRGTLAVFGFVTQSSLSETASLRFKLQAIAGMWRSGQH